MTACTELCLPICKHWHANPQCDGIYKGTFRRLLGQNDILRVDHCCFFSFLPWPHEDTERKVAIDKDSFHADPSMLDSRSQSSSLQKCEIWIRCINHTDSEATLQGSSLISQMGQFKHHLKKITVIDQNRANMLISVSSKWSLKQNKMKHNQRNLYQSPL